MRFRDRADAGRRLAEALQRYAGRDDVVVLALPRGGVPVGFEIARALGAPLDAFVVRKLGVPGMSELAMGAIASGGVRVLNEEVILGLGIDADVIDRVAERELAELERRQREYRGERPPSALEGRTVILVDDGLATGSTMRAAIRAVRERAPARIVVAVPVAAPATRDSLAREVDELVCLHAPPAFFAVGAYFDQFEQTSDADVRDLLERANRAPDDRAPAARADDAVPAADLERDVRIPAGQVSIAGHLAVPAGATGIVLFAHGSGSGRHSPRNRYVAQFLREAGLATLLMDLLTEDEEAVDLRTGHLRFDIGLLAERLVAATDWVREEPATAGLRVGYFGASTGAAAALVAAARRPRVVAAVVSRGGRPDLARHALPHVQAPTLLIVGERDVPVIAMNREAMELMRAEKRLEIVPRATHLFEEPGALEQVAALARDWFLTYWAPAADRRAG